MGISRIKLRTSRTEGPTLTNCAILASYNVNVTPDFNAVQTQPRIFFFFFFFFFAFHRHSFDSGLLSFSQKKINVIQSKFLLKILFRIKSFQMKTTGVILGFQSHFVPIFKSRIYFLATLPLVSWRDTCELQIDGQIQVRENF